MSCDHALQEMAAAAVETRNLIWEAAVQSKRLLVSPTRLYIIPLLATVLKEAVDCLMTAKMPSIS